MINKRNIKVVNLRFFLLICFFLTTVLKGITQDRLYSTFQGNESLFNPSLAGFRGAFTLSGRFVSQWQSSQLNGFQTGLFKLEESLPCSIFDYDLQAEYNKEGTGVYKSVRLGGNFAGTAPFETGNAIHNFRLGLGLVWQFNAINYENLIFSDQLDPKYGAFDPFGNLNPSSFISPQNNRTNWFFTPSVGISHRILFNSENKKSSTLLWGFAIHHLIGLSKNKNWGQAESLLGLETVLPYRVHGFVNFELIPYYKSGQFLSIKPQLNFEMQGSLHYWNIGSNFSLNRNISIGTFLQQVITKDSENTQWLSLQVGLGNTLLNDKKMDLTFSYNIPLTGIRNYLGPFLEAGIAFHFSKSPGCGILGKDNVLAYPGVQCPSSSFSRGRRKLYENIW
jgi:hypothetical protein